MEPSEAKKILGLPSRTTMQEMIKAHRKLVLKYHPDKCKDSGATEKTARLNTAREYLEKHPESLSEDVTSRKKHSPRPSRQQEYVSSLSADLLEADRLLSETFSKVRRDATGLELYNVTMNGLRSYVIGQRASIEGLLNTSPRDLESTVQQLKSNITGLKDQIQALWDHDVILGKTFSSTTTKALHIQSQWALLFFHLEISQGRGQLRYRHSHHFSPPLAAVESRLSTLPALLNKSQEDRDPKPISDESGFFVFIARCLESAKDISAFIAEKGPVPTVLTTLTANIASIVCLTLEFDRLCMKLLTDKLNISNFEGHVRSLLEQLIKVDLRTFQATGDQ